MAYCGKCGNKLDDGVKFCNKCGNSMDGKRSSDFKVETSQPSGVQSTQPSCEQARKIEHSNSSSGSSSNSSKAVMIIMIVLILAGVGVTCFYGYKYFEVKRESAASVADGKNKLQDDKKSEDKSEDKNEDKSSDSQDKAAPEGGDSSGNAYSLPQSSGDFILPESSNALIGEDKLAGLSKESLALARNEIYARHGFVFKTEPYASYFKNKSWYKPDPSYDGGDSALNRVEKDNIQLILKYEKK